MIDSRIDNYIERSAPFAQPILVRLREILRATCPDAEETIKWGMPAFLYRGKILANMAAFKGHAVFGVWRGPEAEKMAGKSGQAMGSLGRLTSLDDLPAEPLLVAMLRAAMAAVDGGTPRRRATEPKPELPLPDDFSAALGSSPGGLQAFEGFAPSHRREYIDWIVSAKRQETRERRIAQAVKWIAEGKKRHWKYENC
jgi:hypothetical protein